MSQSLVTITGYAKSEIVGISAVQQKVFQLKKAIDISYREAGDPKKPTVLLLHGFPTLSHMFRNLIPVLVTEYHALATDYPGYGNSSQPKREDFEYSFKSFANVVDKFLEHKKVKNFSLYLIDYGAPIGFRVFSKNPSRVSAFIIQNGNAYDEGLKKFWDTIKKYWKNSNEKDRDALKGLLNLGATKWQYTHGTEGVTTISSDNWFNDQYLLD
jgi:pimeloyl-ACP methyl ester carboxylesterase